MNRQQFYDALNATLPNAGSPARGLDFVGYDSGIFYATDSYTACLASTKHRTPERFWLPPREAAELMRLVRPTRKADSDGTVKLLVGDGQLDVGVYDADGVGVESSVFELRDPAAPIEVVRQIVETVWAAEPEHDATVWQPALLGRFAKAQRSETDQLFIYPRTGGREARAVVVVGDYFVAAVCGIAFDYRNLEAQAETLALIGAT